MRNPWAKNHVSKDGLHQNYGSWVERRCSAYTKKGDRKGRLDGMTMGYRCSRRTLPGLPYCWQHRNYHW